MRKISVDEFDEVKNAIKKNPFVVVQWDCDYNCLPCKDQFERIASKNYNFPVYSVPICNKSKKIDNYLNNIGVQKVVPCVTIFVNGIPQKINDKSLLGSIEDGNTLISHLYGERFNITNVIDRSYNRFEYMKRKNQI